MVRYLLVALISSLLALLSFAQQAEKENKVLGKSLPEWLAMLRDNENPKFRRAALIALEVYGPKYNGVVSGIVDALKKDSDVEVRRTAAQTLGRMGPDARAAVDVLGDKLQNDKSELVREAAARALGGELIIHSETQVSALATALKDPYAGTRAAAAETLRNLGEKARAALPDVVVALEDPKLDVYTRIYSAQILGGIGQNYERTLPALTSIAGDTTAPVKVRLATIDAVAGLAENAKSATPLLAKTLDDSTAGELRLAAAIALEKIGAEPKATWSAVKNALTSPTPALRHQAIRLAGRAGSTEPEAITLLINRASKDDNTENRLAAIQELAELGAAARGAEESLAKLAQDDARASIRDAAAAAAKKIKSAME